MNKQELIEKIADSTGLSKKDATNSVECFVETVQETLKKRDKVAISGFGTFELKLSKAKTSRNPKTGESVHVPEKWKPKFRPAKAFKDLYV